MTWDVINTLISVIGVTGGLISIYFVILGIRRNAQAVEGATVQSLMSFEKDVFNLLVNNAGLYLRGRENIAGLTAEEKFQFVRIVAVQMSLTYSAFVQHGEGLIDDEVWEAYVNALRGYIAAPGFHMAWKSFEMSYPKSFRDAIEGI